MAILCHSCFQDIPAASLRCPRCGAALPRREPAPGQEPAGTPWQRRSRGGFLAAFGETLERSLLEPTAFFREVRPGGGGDALGFAIVVNVVTTSIAWLWRSALAGPLPPDARGTGPWLAAGLLLVFVPLATVAAAVGWSAVLHLSLTVTGAARRSFSCTLQAVAYAASANSFSVFPLVGSLIGIPWGIVLQITGLRECHGISTGRAVFAWLLPLLFFLAATAALFYAALDTFFELLPKIEGLIMT